MELSSEILNGNISALAKGITLVESTLLSDQKKLNNYYKNVVINLEKL